jgi:DNA-binding response OmpR family regulator
MSGVHGTVLVVEDDAAIRRGLADALDLAGYAVREASDGLQGLDGAARGGLDLVLLDVGLPKLDGFQLLEKLRASHPGLPVIMLTARGAEEDRVRGLRRGADDYVVKPFAMGELVARIEAVLRRSPARPKAVGQLAIGGRSIDFERREAVLPAGERVQLTEREAGLLEYLARNPGRAVAREELLRNVWGIDPRGVETRTIDMAVLRLRERLGDSPEQPAVIVTVRGKGYMLGA